MVSITIETLQNDDQDDRRSNYSVASTVATTTSLQSRIAALALDFNDKLQEQSEDGIAEEAESDCEGEKHSRGRQRGGASESGSVEDNSIDLPREALFQVCSRLFLSKPGHPLCLRRLSIQHLEDFRQHGYLVVDNFISKDLASSVKHEACRMLDKGRLQPINGLEGLGEAIRQARRQEQGLLLQPGRPPADTPPFSTVLVALQEMQEDLQEVMDLTRGQAEYLLACQMPSGRSLGRHLDSVPDEGASHQRRVTAVVFCNSDWDRDQGGILRLWPPVRVPGAMQASAVRTRSTASSDCGTTLSEPSDCGSLGSHLLGSISSSMMAVASAHEHDVASLDGLSVAESEVEKYGLEWLEVGGTMVLDIAPHGGRMVLMLSGAVEHGIQTSATSLVSLTAWCR